MPASICFWRAALAALVIAAPSVVQAQQALVWESNLDQARSIAAQTNRLVLIHFGAPWCEPCNELERIVFNHPGFGSTLGASYVAVKLNIDEHVSLARYYGVETIPTDAVISSQGQLIYKTASPRTPDEYVATMSRVAASAGLAAQPSASGAQNSTAQSTGSAPFAPPIAGYASGPAATTPPSVGYNPSAPQPSAAPRAPESPWSAQAAPAQNANSSPASSGLDTPDNRYADYFTNRQAAPTGAPSQAAPQGAPWTPPPAAQGPSAPNVSVTGIATAPTGSSTIAQPSVAGVVAAQPSSTQAPQIPPGNPPLGLDGFCAVTLCEKRGWQRGDARWGAIHRGRTYLFASDEAQKAFLANPERYSPVASGADPVLALDMNQDVPGQRQHGVFYDGRIYLFSSKESLDRFSQNPTRYAAEILQARR